jgi:ATP-binding protein involved in chromosome partitioning
MFGKKDNADDTVQITEQQILAALGTVQDPELHRDLVSLDMIKNVTECDGIVRFTIVLTTMACPLKDKITGDAKAAVMKVPGVKTVNIDLTSNTPSHQSASPQATPQRGKQTGGVVLQDLLPTVRNVVAVASGKGGVGKSTVATNIAVALAKDGASVGLLDADIYGPSIPTMLGINEQPRVTQEEKLVPIEKYGMQVMSIGFILEERQSVVWRGPMAAKMIQQFLTDVLWGDLDYLIIDLPPGTGDIQLTITQSVPLAGGLIVSTPQAVALADVRRGASMFEKVEVPILGVVENMSTFICPNCGHEEHIFDTGGAKDEAEKLGAPFLGAIPIDAEIREGADAGVPITIGTPDGPIAEAFHTIAREMAAAISVTNVEARRDERNEPLDTGSGKGLPML